MDRWMDDLMLPLTLPGMGLPAILALAISELVLRGTLRRAIPPSSSELDRWPWPWSRCAAPPWPWPWPWLWLWRAQTRGLKLTLYLGNQYILYRRQRVTYTVLKPKWATHTVFGLFAADKAYVPYTCGGQRDKAGAEMGKNKNKNYTRLETMQTEHCFSKTIKYINYI